MLDLHGDEVAIDIGCGTGRLTALLAERLPSGCVVAVDRSQNMTRVAAETLGSFTATASVAVADASALPFDNAFDVAFSTATFHWILDHDRLFAVIHSALRPGGRLHAQCGGGANLQRIHQRARALMGATEFASCFRDWSRPWEFADAETTRTRLEHAGFVDIETDVEEAAVVLPNADAFTAFVSAVVLRPFLAKIEDEYLRKSFVEQITAAAAADRPSFELDYWRLNIRARRAL